MNGIPTAEVSDSVLMGGRGDEVNPVDPDILTPVSSVNIEPVSCARDQSGNTGRVDRGIYIEEPGIGARNGTAGAATGGDIPGGGGQRAVAFRQAQRSSWIPDVEGVPKVARAANRPGARTIRRVAALCKTAVEVDKPGKRRRGESGNRPKKAKNSDEKADAAGDWNDGKALELYGKEDFRPYTWKLIWFTFAEPLTLSYGRSENNDPTCQSQSVLRAIPPFAVAYNRLNSPKITFHVEPESILGLNLASGWFIRAAIQPEPMRQAHIERLNVSQQIIP
jgi:hypothetical protein